MTDILSHRLTRENAELREENNELKRQLVLHEANNKHNREAFAAIANSDNEMVERYLAGSELFRNAFWSYNHYLLGKIHESGNKELYSEVYNKLPTGWGALDRMRHDYYKDSMWESVREFCEVAAQVASEATGKPVEEVRNEINNRSFQISSGEALERNSEFLAIRLANVEHQLTALQAAQEWREIEKEKPCRTDKNIGVPPLVLVGMWINGKFETGTSQWWNIDGVDGHWSGKYRWTHWKPLGENPKEVSSNGE